MAKEQKRLGEILIEAKLISPQQLNAAIADQKKSGQLLGTTLIQLGFVTEHALVSQLQRQLNLPLVDLNAVTPEEAALHKIKKAWAKKCAALPLRLDGKYLVTAMADPLDVAALENLRFQSGMRIRPALAGATAIFEAIERLYLELEHCPACGDYAGDCERCHRQLASRWRFCANCGTPVPARRAHAAAAAGASTDREVERRKAS
jgi:hypothetical protein